MKTIRIILVIAWSIIYGPLDLSRAMQFDAMQSENAQAELCPEGNCSDPDAFAWSSGLDVVIAKPFYGRNPSLLRVSQPQSQQFVIDQQEFDFDFTSSPRVWIAGESASGVGVRATWWQYASEADPVSMAPAANGFERIEHPVFGDVDISAITPTERLSAAASLEIYWIDLEMTRRAKLGIGEVLLSGGLRFASLEQRYQSEQLNANAVKSGEIDYVNRVRGIGPTISLTWMRQITKRWSWEAMGRGSLLAGEGEERLDAAEDLDFINPQFTTRTGGRDQLLPIADLRLGTSYALRRVLGIDPLLRTGWETSWYGDVSNCSGSASDLGFLGFYAGIEGRW
jgi:hypothetical protein